MSSPSQIRALEGGGRHGVSYLFTWQTGCSCVACILALVSLIAASFNLGKTSRKKSSGGYGGAVAFVFVGAILALCTAFLMKAFP